MAFLPVNNGSVDPVTRPGISYVFSIHYIESGLSGLRLRRFLLAEEYGPEVRSGKYSVCLQKGGPPVWRKVQRGARKLTLKSFTWKSEANRAMVDCNLTEMGRK